MAVKQARRSTQTPAPQPRSKRPEAGKGRKKAARRSKVYPAANPLSPDDAVLSGSLAEQEQDQRSTASNKGHSQSVKRRWPPTEKSVRKSPGSAEQPQEQISLWLCRAVMSENPMCCLPGDPVDMAARLMVTEDVGVAPRG